MPRPLSRYFSGSFFGALGQEAIRVRRARPASATLVEVYGIAPSPSLERLVDFLSTHEPSLRLGAFGWFGEQGGYTVKGDWLPERQNALEHALGQPYRTPAALAGALAIGCDYSGNIWLASLESHGGTNEVFLHDHDTDEVRPFASSLEAFALVMGILERGDGRITEPEKAMLHGRVDGVALARAFSHSGMKSSRFTPKSAVGRRVRAAGDLIAVLTHREAYPLAPVPEGKRSHPSDVVADLLRLFLRGEDAVLEERMRANVRHEARFVRDAVRYLRPHLAATKRSPRGDALTVARATRLAPRVPEFKSVWRSKREQADALVAEAIAQQAAGRHVEALSTLERAITAHIAHPKAWVAKCYSLFELERWKDMKRAAAFAVRVASDDTYAHQQLAAACTQLDDFEGSIAAGRRAMALDPKNAYACFNLAVALAESGDASATRIMKRALTLNPALKPAAEDPDIRRAFARLRRGASTK